MKMQTSHSVRRSVVVAFTAAAFGPLAAMAAEDFTRYSNEELVQRRNEVQNLGEADRLRYREEMQQRTQNMSPEERRRLGIGRDDAAAQGTQAREHTGEDRDRGQGEMKRERQRVESGDGYGRGYESRQGGSSAGSAGGFGGRGAGGGGRGR